VFKSGNKWDLFYPFTIPHTNEQKIFKISNSSNNFINLLTIYLLGVCRH